MPPEPVDLLIEARWVLPIAPVNTVLADHAVAITNGRIVTLGPIAELNARFAARNRVVRSGHALLPGFVNAHTCAAMTLLRELPVLGPRGRWLRSTVRPAEERCMSADFVRHGTQLAIAEMLRAGITSFADMYWFPEETARAASAARMRAAIGLPVADVPNRWADSATGHLARAERLWDEYQTDPWVSLYFASHDVNGLSDQTLVRIRRVADELDARVAMVLHESAAEVGESVRRHGRRPLQRLQELGLLRPGFTAVHMGELGDEDVSLVATTAMCVVACTQSDLRLDGAACPLQWLDIQHVACGLGTADPVSAAALDVLAEARAAALIARRLAPAGPPAQGLGRCGELAAADLLRIATLGGANALGLGTLTGSIEPGKAADLVCWDLGTAATPFVPQSAARVPDCLVFGSSRQQATDVWTSGRAALSNGELLAFDDRELQTLVQHWAGRVLTGGET
jgi:5-methylthioadenosine/S-adenosylhomocysteine deaminase